MSLFARTLTRRRRRPARIWHRSAINRKQYGFPNDDYAGQSSDISVTNPQYAVVAVGW
jgi:hypothetical protein